MSGNVSKTLAGVFTPTIVPLDERGEINETEFRRYIDWLVDRGVHGLYPNGSTGEFLRFTPEERKAIVRISCDQAGARIPVLAGAAEANVRETLQACERYLEYGARATAIVSPFYYRLSPGAVYSYFREIAVNSPIDITLYNIPAFASPIDIPTIRRLAELPRIIGIKDSSGDIAQMLRMMAAVEPVRPDFVFMTGWEPAMTPMIAMGCQGATLAMSGVVPEVTRRLFDLAASGHIAEARALQMQLTELFDLSVLSVDFPEGVRAAVEMRGFKCGAGRQPQDESKQIDKRGLRRLLDALLEEPRST